MNYDSCIVLRDSFIGAIDTFYKKKFENKSREQFRWHLRAGNKQKETHVWCNEICQISGKDIVMKKRILIVDDEDALLSE
jgi:NAD kinase